MKPTRREDIGPGVAALNAELLGDLPGAVKVGGIDGTPRAEMASEVASTKQDVRDEKELQRLCEQELSRRGFWLVGTSDPNPNQLCAGNYAHIWQAKRNPPLPDLMIWNAKWTRFLGVELKTPTGRLRPVQRMMTGRGAWKLARTFDEFKAELVRWEEGR